MTVCEICNQIDMTTINDICRDCQREADEYDFPIKDDDETQTPSKGQEE